MLPVIVGKSHRYHNNQRKNIKNYDSEYREKQKRDVEFFVEQVMKIIPERIYMFPESVKLSV